MKKYLIPFILLFSMTSFFQNTAWAIDRFVIKKIEIRGLHRLSAAAVETYLPVKRGQVFTEQQSAQVLKALYKSDFFEHIALFESDGVLIIDVVERQTIGQLDINGNTAIPMDRLTTVLKSLDIVEGRTYNPLVLERVKQGLANQYLLLGYNNARINVTAKNMSRGRVLVSIKITEGELAKISKITVNGNHVFSDKILLKQFGLSTTGLFTYFTQSDRYSEQALNIGAEKIRNYYLNHGYLRATVTALPKKITSGSKKVEIVISVIEGNAYTVLQVELAGKLILSRADLSRVIPIHSGDVFSREKIIEAQKAMTTLYGHQGYLSANINLKPELDDKKHTVKLIFEISPGKRTYVRHIDFADNTRTNDDVLRREVEQMEAAPASTKRLEESKHKLSLLPFIKDVEMTINPVPDEPELVDAVFKVKEDNSAQATFKIGYSQNYGALIGLGLNQKNVFGTGNNLGINFQRNKYEDLYAVDYINPYYTMDGISRAINFSISRVDPGSISRVNNGYTANEYNLGLLYGFPIGQQESVYTRLIAGITYQNILIKLNAVENVSEQVKSFVGKYGRNFQEADIKIGLSRDSRDKAIFPTRGVSQSIALDIFAPLSQDSLLFYMLNYHAKWYQPLYKSFILLAQTDLGYGMGQHGVSSYPFFKNFYAGGIDSVRGYSGYTLGPRDSTGKAIGGNKLIDASLGLILPSYFSENIRTTLFVDAGNVYSGINNQAFGGMSRGSGSLRYSFGVEVDWLTAFGPIKLSLAKALNPRSSRPHGGDNGDEEEPFQFALGASF